MATVKNLASCHLEEDFGEILKVLGFFFRIRSIFAQNSMFDFARSKPEFDMKFTDLQN